MHAEFGVKKQLLDDLYIRFIRLAEERIGEAAEYGVVSYISNSSYLTGRSHPLMRRSLLTNFNRVWIDNLNGDKYRTGKIIPRGLPGAGTRDDSAFTTEMDPRGIQPGTAIVTWVKRKEPKRTPGETKVLYREFWGVAAGKRAGLLLSLPTETAPAGNNVPAYEAITPTATNRWRLSPQSVEAGYEAWPALDELFPTSFQGVNDNRGVEGGIIDTDRTRLADRLKRYFGAKTFERAKQISPEIATPRARYEPESVWSSLKAEGHFSEDSIKPFLLFPFDQRFIYYVDAHKWLNEARPEFGRNAADNEWLITVPEPRKASETWPAYSRELVNLHVHERGSVVFPRETKGTDLLSDRDANLAEGTWRILKKHFGLSGDRRDADARAFVGTLFRVAFAALHSSAYQMGHKSALSADWAHLAVPKDAALLKRLSAAGDQIARLIDVESDAQAVIEAVLGAERARALGALKRADGNQVRPSDLAVTVTYWGGGKGRWKPRPYGAGEAPDPNWELMWGERTGDLFINDEAFFAHVPEAVWGYQLGGYPVLKKWLGYRQADRREEQTLTDDERRWFRQIVQRVAALLALGPTLDALYQEAASNAFTAVELGITR